MRNLHETGKAVLLIRVLNPYCRKYRELVAGEWKTRKRYSWLLSSDTLRDFEQSIGGQKVTAFYPTTSTRSIALDIDDHAGHAWISDYPSAKLLQLMDFVRSRMGGEPSMLVRSPRGLHAFYFLVEYLPVARLRVLTQRRLKEVASIEVKCGVNQTLRVPVEKNLLDPVSYAQWTGDMYSAIENARRYHVAELFGLEALEPPTYQERRKARAIRYNDSARIRETEIRLLPFANHATNDAFLQLCNLYRCSGFSEEEAVLRFREALDGSPDYHGDLRDANQLRRRIRYEYAKNRDFVGRRSTTSGDSEKREENRKLAEKIAGAHPWAPQATSAVLRLIEGILNMVDVNETEMRLDPEAIASKSFFYGYHRHNIKSGYHPLPSSALKKLHGDYKKVIAWLTKIGFLELAPFGYSTITHTCKHYRINRRCLSTEP